MKKIFLDLKKQPFANDFKKKLFTSKKITKILFDDNNCLVSLSPSNKSKVMFPNNYPFRSSESKMIVKHYKKLSKFIKFRFKPKKILEIGSNDGAFAFNFNKKLAICIEPCKDVSQITKRRGYVTINKYFNDFTVKYINKKFNKFDLVFSANTITHIPNIYKVVKNLNNILNDRGVLILQEPWLLNTIKNCTYDQFYNEHLYVFSALSVKKIFEKYNLEIFDIKFVNVHGGSLLYFIKKKINNKLKVRKSVKKFIDEENKCKLNKFSTYQSFSRRVKQNKSKFIKIITDLKKKGTKIIGYGATAKSVTVINFCGLNKNHIDYFLDTTKEKQNKYVPGTNIIVKKYKKLKFNNKLCVFLGAWNFKNEIFKKESDYRKKGGKFLVHTPYPKII